MPDLRVLGGRYQLVDRVGRGGMGAVWRARDRLLGRDVAVKEILLPHGLDEEQLAIVRGRALREARAAAQVRHPAVVTIHDVIIEDDHPWIVMDFVQARSLADRLEGGDALAVSEAARVGEALAEALRAIHDKGIVHRDLKPANVLIDAAGQVVLTDFGIATIEGDVRFTASGLLIGTPGFMAPERLSGEPSGPPSDLWALGAVLYAAVEGHSPYEGSTPMVVASAVLTKEPLRPRRAGPLAQLITDLLARNPADRPDARHAADRLASLARTPEARTGRVNPPTTQEWIPHSRTPGPSDPMPRPSGGGGASPGSGGAPIRDGRGPAAGPARAARPAPASGDRGPGGRGPGNQGIGPVPDWFRRPDTAQTVERAPRGWKRILSPVPIRVAAVVVTVAAAVGVAWYVISGPAVDPCTLLSADQANQLAPNSHKESNSPPKGPDDMDNCSWDETEVTGLIIGVASYSKAEEATAALHKGEGTYRLDAALDISGIGNEVHAFDVQLTHSIVVLFRRNGHYVEVSYGGIGSQHPKATEQTRAFQAARWADAKLSALDR